MGYRSKVHALVYGPEDVMCPLIAKHQLLGKDTVFDSFAGSIRQFTAVRRIYDAEATMMQEPGPRGERPAIFNDVKVEVIELSNQNTHDWKWYEDYPDVQAWHAFMEEAAENGGSYEFVRVGEEPQDIDIQQHVEDEGDTWLGVSTRIHCDVGPPEDADG